MADKRRVKRSIKQLQRVKTWQLVVLLILMSLLSATFLRLNNVGMFERRNAVLAADESGKSDATLNRLYDLQRYVSAHMNTNTGQFYLEGQYKRDSKKAIEAANKDTDPSQGVHAKAARACDGQFTVWSQAYVQCFAAELAKYRGSNTLDTTLDLPRTDLYRHEFIGPIWSPDFAGWSVLVCLVLAFMIIVRMISLLILKLLLRRHYHAI